MYAQSPMRFAPGINPEADDTEQNTINIIEGDNIRFHRGQVEKIGGHKSFVLDTSLSGCPRSILSFEESNNKWQIVGTHTKLYAILAGTVYNITPLQTSAAATLGTDPIRSLYDNQATISANAFTFTSGSKYVSVRTTILDSNLVIGESFTVAGATGTINGVPSSELNGTHRVIYFDGNGYPVILVSTAATSSGTPSTSGVTAAAAKIRIAYTSHNQAVGDRIRLSGATGPVGGIPASEINAEHEIVALDGANAFVVNVSTTATSYVDGGGSSVDIFLEIADGECDAVAASGPGIGTPGYGLPGQIFSDTSLIVQPRIWWLDTYGDTLVCGPGQGGDCYQWDGNTATAPAKITNSPTADWGWVEDAKLVVFDGNVQTNSDTGDITNWSTGSYFTDAREDMTQFVARAYVNGENIIFSDEGRAFRLRFVGGTKGWTWREIDSPVQIAGPNAHFVIGGMLYIFGENNLFVYNGGAFQPLPNNTLYKFMFDDINLLQRYKFFVWYNRKYDEVHFHYCSGSSDENDRAVFFRRGEGWFSKRAIDRTAFDTTEVVDYPILSDSSGTIYEHEIGYNDDTSAMNSYYQVAFQAAQNGKIYTEILGAELDTVQTGNMTVELYKKDRANKDAALLQSFTISPDTEEIECVHEARWRSWLFRSNVVDGFFRSGAIMEYLQPGGEF